MIWQALLPGSAELAGGNFSPDPKVCGLQKGFFFFFFFSSEAVRQETGEGERESSRQGNGERN